MKKINLLFICVILTSLSTIAQVTYAKPEDFKNIKKRPLVVENMELNEKSVESLEKKISKTSNTEKKEKYKLELENYKKFVNDFNTYVKSTVKTYFNLNSEIIFKSTSEIKELLKAKSTKYTLLYYSESTSNRTDQYGFKYFPNLTIPTLNYTRAESGKIKVDYSFFMPYTGQRDRDEIKEEDFILSFTLMKNHIEEIEKTGEKKYSFRKYLEDQAKKNMPQLNNQTLIINKNQIHNGSSIESINEAYNGKVLAVSEDEINASIKNKKDAIIGVIFAYDILIGGIGPLSAARISCLKTFINTKTGMVYTCIGTEYGQTNDQFFRTNQFKKYTNE